jgi:lysyl-tRNA synthetase class 1
VQKVIEKASSADEVQEKVFEISKRENVAAKELFSALYAVLLGKQSGPKFGSLVFVLGKERVIKRLSEVV